MTKSNYGYSKVFSQYFFHFFKCRAWLRKNYIKKNRGFCKCVSSKDHH